MELQAYAMFYGNPITDICQSWKIAKESRHYHTTIWKYSSSNINVCDEMGCKCGQKTCVYVVCKLSSANTVNTLEWFELLIKGCYETWCDQCLMYWHQKLCIGHNTWLRNDGLQCWQQQAVN